MGGAQSTDETKGITEAEPDARSEKEPHQEKKEGNEEKEEDDEEEELVADPVVRIFHLLRKPVVDEKAIREVLNKEGEAKVNLNIPDLPPVIDPNADPNDPAVIKMKERIAKKTYLGDFPLHILVGRPTEKNTPELLELVKFFFLKEHQMNCRNKLGSTPLHRACASGNAPMAQELIKWGAQVDAVNEMQLTCLHMACYAGYSEVVKLLLENGCVKHITFKSVYGIAPCDYVLRDEIKEMLVKARRGAKPAAATGGSAKAGQPAEIKE